MLVVLANAVACCMEGADVAKFVGELGMCHTKAGLTLIKFLQQSCLQVFDHIQRDLHLLQHALEALDNDVEMNSAKGNEPQNYRRWRMNYQVSVNHISRLENSLR
jgi:hypothetical protein